MLLSQVEKKPLSNTSKKVVSFSLTQSVFRTHNNNNNNRLRNKTLYFKAGVKKLMNRGSGINVNQVVTLEVDHQIIDLSSSGQSTIKGLIFLNINSWGAGMKPWGSATSKRFQPPNIGDGLLEVFGVTGLPHMVSGPFCSRRS